MPLLVVVVVLVCLLRCLLCPNRAMKPMYGIFSVVSSLHRDATQPVGNGES